MSEKPNGKAPWPAPLKVAAMMNVASLAALAFLVIACAVLSPDLARVRDGLFHTLPELPFLLLAFLGVTPACFLILVRRRHISSVGFHFVSAIGIAFVALRVAGPLAPWAVALGALQALLGIALLTPDVLAPFLAAEQRHWRRSRRVTLGALSRLEIGGTSYPAVLRDFSRHGARVAVDAVALDDILECLKRSDSLILHLGNRSAQVKATCRWSKVSGHEALIGLAIASESESDFAGLVPMGLSFERGFIHRANALAAILQRKSFRRFTAVAYPLSVVILFAVTCCGAADAVHGPGASRNYESGDNSATLDGSLGTSDANAQALRSQSSEPASFSLAGKAGPAFPESMTLAVTGCVSGFARTFAAIPTSRALDLRLVRGDRGCRARLNSFRIGTVTFTPENGVFNPTLGAVTRFTDLNRTTRDVRVDAQISDPVSGPQRAAFTVLGSAGLGAASNIAVGGLGILALTFAPDSIFEAEPATSTAGAILRVELSVRGDLGEGRLVAFTLGGTAVEGTDFRIVGNIRAFSVDAASAVAVADLQLLGTPASRNGKTLRLDVRHGPEWVVDCGSVGGTFRSGAFDARAPCSKGLPK